MARRQDKPTVKWFSLARELRDTIYEELYTVTAPVKITRKWSVQLRARAHNLPAPRLLLVSRQFGEEYRSVVDKKTTLVVHDYFDSPNNAIHLMKHSLALSHQVSKMPAVQLELFLSPPLSLACECTRDAEDRCSLAMDVALLMQWVSVLLSQMSQLKAVTVNLHQSNETDYAFSDAWNGLKEERKEQLKEHIAAVTTLPHAITVTTHINPGVYGTNVQRWDYAHPEQRATMQWTAATGEFRSIDE